MLLVDDNSTFIRAMTTLRETYRPFQVIGAMLSGIEGFRLAIELAPDIALLDFDRADRTGVETIGYLKRAAPPLRTIILSRHDEHEYASSALLAGGDRIVAKHRATEDLLPPLKQLAEWTVA